jgi:hypothetical protein
MADLTKPQPQTPPESGWMKLWKNLMGVDALKKASGESARPVNPPENQDMSVVRRAAEEAGRRMQEEKASEAPPRQPVPAKYACGGVVSRYGRYPK